MEHQHFEVLGDHAEEEYPQKVQFEREQHGLARLPAFISIRRAWRYWCVDFPYGTGLPAQFARKLNQLAGKWVRVDGFAGGREDKEIAERSYINSWHIDTHLGLDMLVNAILESLAYDPQYYDNIADKAYANACYKNKTIKEASAQNEALLQKLIEYQKQRGVLIKQKKS